MDISARLHFMGIAEDFQRIQHQIQSAAVRSGRDPASVTLIAVTKTVPSERIRQAAACGIRHAGENRLQDALSKMDVLKDLHLQWHFIGHIQTNKARKVGELFDCIQSIDRTELAEKLGQVVQKTLPVLIEVKLHDEPRKSGAIESELPALIEAVRARAHLDLRGLMAVPPFFDNPEDVRPYFKKLRELARQFELPELSMGMTHDFEVAIEEGATMVRIGRGLFGERQ
jgi:pyridoxal phosphate enzyme (YggS family)